MRIINCLLPVLWLLMIMLSSCAIRVTPTGGVKDENPPKVLKTDPENYSTGFDKKKFKIEFDELIELKSLQSQLIVSPLLSEVPTTTVKGRDLIVEFKDTLKPNTTYTFNFGKSIVDVNEGNALLNYQYVFSTGSQRDSLQISGTVVNALTLQPEKGVSVFLYRSDDTLTINHRPDYFTTTNEAGTFAINNLPEGQYKLAAIKDENNNFVFDNGESLAFYHAEIRLPDTILYELKLFKQPEMSVRLMNATVPEKNKAIISFSKPCNDFNLEIFTGKLKPADLLFEINEIKDTLIIWVADTTADSLNAVLRSGTTLIDTVRLQLKTEARLMVGRGAGSGRLIPILPVKEGFFDMNDKLLLHFNRPVKNFKTDQLVLLLDSVAQKIISVSAADSIGHNFILDYKPLFKSKYKLIVPKDCATDFTGIRCDSSILSFNTREERDYGSIDLKFSTNDKSENIIQLLTADHKVARTQMSNNNNRIAFMYLLPGNYLLRCIKDTNKNGIWDAGNYFLNLQPEPVTYYFETIVVRANWDIEINWELK